MNNTLYDVIIIGAGPSGTSCAYNILRLKPDAKVLLIDKTNFPRYKPCGGGVSPEVANYLDFPLESAINYKCNQVVMVANGKEIESNQHELWMVRREVFDNYLLEKAKSAGAEFIGNCEVKDIIHQNDGSTLVTTEDQQFSGKIIVLAEGGRGKLAKRLGIAPENTILAAMEYEHYSDQDLDGKLYIDFDYNDSGYAWNFPKNDGLSLGIGGLIKGKEKGKVNLPKKLSTYVAKFGVEQFNKTNLHGHPIELYKKKHKLVHNNIVLIGEIAGCVDPLTAEGIRPAIKSGYLAAKRISQVISSDKTKLLNQYTRDFHLNIGKDLRRARIMSFFLNRYMHQVLPMLTTKNAINGFMDVFSGKSSYIEKINFRRIVKLCLRSLKPSNQLTK